MTRTAAIAVSAASPEDAALAVRLIERSLLHLGWPVTVDCDAPSPTTAEIADQVADARARELRFSILAA